VPNPIGEPWHFDAAGCQNITMQLDAVANQVWLFGPLITNENVPQFGQIHEAHTGVDSYPERGAMVKTDHPGKISRLTGGNYRNGLTPQLVQAEVHNNREHGCGTMAYDMNPSAWRVDQGQVLQAIGNGVRE
jgi:hypothetical protein